ncbi:Dienelactone hydrolase family [Desulfosarcina cetonica]|uniref:dienelactone hydrolase family protein n=1 Tax=Desulfosarcina cetonica TaxID=90730 RepID=UPI0006D0C733|nr:dienelactone hydrolase family protein [Desulfosarcina cetonica]VTR71407.1 Dienelactone hydrolase family [Desulfosarcina cetonica]
MKTRFIIFLSIILGAATMAQAKVVNRPIVYSHDGVTLEGFLAYDDAVSGKMPGILVVHEWWGLNEYARNRAEKLAAMGYVAFALDMYGKGKVTDHPDQAGAWMKAVNSNMALWQERAMAGLEVLKKQPQVDVTRLAAIGYCFGGATVQVLAYSGADLKGVVSFHGSLMPPTVEKGRQTKAKILICHGAMDPMNTPQSVAAYMEAMNATTIDWQLAVFGNTRHSFTNPDADKHKMAALAYNASSDRRSWQYMTLFFQELFPTR